MTLYIYKISKDSLNFKRSLKNYLKHNILNTLLFVKTQIISTKFNSTK